MNNLFFLRQLATTTRKGPLTRTASIMMSPVNSREQSFVLKREFAELRTELPPLTFRQVRFVPKQNDKGETKITRVRLALNTASLTKGKLIVRGMPGANTPTCTDFDLDDLVKNLRKYKEAGYQVALLLTADSIDTNYKWIKDALFSAGWLTPEELNDPDIVAKYLTIITDNGKKLANDVLGLMFESEELGVIPKRAVAIFNNGRLADIFAEEKASEYKNVSVDAVLARAVKLGLDAPKAKL